jgi:hypothetical protein
MLTQTRILLLPPSPSPLTRPTHERACVCQLRTPDTTLSSSRILLQAMRSHLAFPLQYASPCRGCYIPRLTLHDTRHTIHVLHNTSHVTCAHLHESHHKSHVTRHTSHITRRKPRNAQRVTRLRLKSTRHALHFTASVMSLKCKIDITQRAFKTHQQPQSHLQSSAHYQQQASY